MAPPNSSLSTSMACAAWRLPFPLDMLSTASRLRILAGRFSCTTTVQAASLSAVVPLRRTVCSHFASAWSFRSCSCSYDLARRSSTLPAVARACFTSSACRSSLTPASSLTSFFFPFFPPVASLSSLMSASCSCHGVPSNSLSITVFIPTREKPCLSVVMTGVADSFAGLGPTLSFQARVFLPAASFFGWPFPGASFLVTVSVFFESTSAIFALGCLGLGAVLKSLSSKPLPAARPS
mmetsp:Transcript_37867/g.63677  ORF Transcript_37867/g.63677 Transcript_37867/m.63677 type:complete len:237 (-) Transcript_37867:85-795(-)